MTADIIVLSILLVSVLVSFFRGFIKEVLTIAGIIGGAFSAWAFGGSLTPTFRGWMVDPEAEEPEKLWGIVPWTFIADTLAYLSVFLIVMIALSVISHVLSRFVESVGLGPVDRTLGIFFGLLRGFLLIGLLYLPFYLELDEEKKEEWFGDSVTMPYVERTSEFLEAFLPEKIEREKETDEDIEDKTETKPSLMGEDDPISEEISEEQETPANTETSTKDTLEELIEKVQ